MKTRPLATLAIKLIGFYSIFSGIQMFPMVFATTVSFFSTRDRSSFIYALVAPLFPIVFGVLLIRRTGKVANYLFPNDEVLFETNPLDLETLQELSFSILGLFCLINSVPGALQCVAQLIRYTMASLSGAGGGFDRFMPDLLVSILCQFAATGFSLYVFLRGKSVAKFAASLRKT